MSIAQNTALFSLLGTLYGGDGQTNFALPNLQGTTLIGDGQGPGLPPETEGGAAGSANVTLTTAEMPQSLGGNSQAFDNYEPSLPIHYEIATDGVLPAANSGGDNLGMVGVVMPFALNFDPGGFLECDGQLLSVAQYPDLFNILGTTYGGDGVTTFELPDLRGRDIVGASASHSLGEQFGQPGVSLTNNQVPTPSAQPFDNEQPSLALNYIIATAGIFPSHGDPSAADDTVPFLGQIVAFAGDFVPRGWALCDGQLLSIAQNTALFSLLGTLYGGNGQTTFALPNLEDRVVIGASGVYPIGTVVGANAPTITAAQLPAFSMATLGVHQATLNQVPGGFAIADTAANIGSFAGLAALAGDAGHITAITATDTPVVVGFGRFGPYQAALDKIAGGFTFDGQAPVIQANIDAIAADATHINSITAENGAVAVSVATFLNDTAALNKIAGGFAISDSAAHIFNGLGSLQADVAAITTITATDVRVQVGVGKFIPDEAALDKIVGGFDILGLSAAIGANFDALTADISHIGSVAFADPSTPVLNLTQTQATNDAALLAKITSPYVLNASSGGATTTTGHGDNLTITAVTGGNDTITGGGNGESFVFGANFGVDTIVDFSTHLAGPGNDTITLPSAEFTDFTTMFNNHTTFSGGNAIIQAGGDQLTLLNMTSVTLSGAAANFHFV